MTALLVLPDGREIYSGEVGQDAILSLTLTAGVNDTQELTLGSVCASMVEAELLVPEGELGVKAGEEVTLYWIDGENREKAGIFVAEKPEKTGNGTYSLTAYDRVSRLDQDVTQWLEGLEGWPYSLLDFGKLVCQHCGVELANTEIPNGDYEVAKFAARGITGRQLLFWVGEAAGRFLRATPEGTLLLDWYTPAEKTVSASGEDFYYQDTLTWSDYRTAPIDRVQLRFDEGDVGTIYPPEAAGNTYAVTGNYLLTAENAQSLLPVAEVLYGALSGVQYTPCKLTVPSRLGIREGQIFTVVTPTGERLTAYVMSRTASRGRDTLECTGSPTREASTAVTSQSYKALSGKILRLQTNVDGLTVENQDMTGRLTAITANVEGITARVEKTETTVTTVQADSLTEAITQYYLSSSTTELSGGSWSETAPEWVDGKYMWSRTKTTKGDGSVSYSAPTCIAGATGAQGEKGDPGANGVGVQSVDVQYYLSTSAATLSGGSWSTTAPAWENGKYMWSKTVTTLTNGGVEESKPVCITGAKGSTGASGTTITSITEQYYLSTSKTTQSGGSWVEEPPAWSAGKYLWTRSKIAYANPTKTEYTTPVCDSSWEAVNDVQVGARNLQLGTQFWDDTCIRLQGNAEIVGEEITIPTGTYTELEKIQVKNGDVYTIGCDVKSNVAYDGNSFLIQFFHEAGNRLLYEWAAGSIGTDWRRVVKTLQVTRTESPLFLGIGLRANSGVEGVNCTLTYRHLMVERGTKATDWTPAPEDTQVQIDDVVSDVADQQVVITSQESRIASLELSNETISAAVEKVRTDTQTTMEGVEEAITRLEERAELAVTAEDVSIAITERLEDGVSSVTTETGYTFNQDGMRIAKSGEEMENRLDNTGMYVTRSGEGILTANNQGVTALNLQAVQYLMAGEHARFEDYEGDRTGCFWI